MGGNDNDPTCTYEEGTFYLIGEVDERMESLVHVNLTRAEKAGIPTILVYISTYGGSLDSLYSIYDRFKDSPANIVTISSGKVMSAGILLLTAGQTRLAYPNTMFMQHNMQVEGLPEDFWELEKQVKRLKKHNDKWFTNIAAATKKPVEFWRDKCKGNDFEFDTEAAIRYGLIDGIMNMKETMKNEQRELSSGCSGEQDNNPVPTKRKRRKRKSEKVQ